MLASGEDLKSPGLRQCSDGFEQVSELLLIWQEDIGDQHQLSAGAEEVTAGMHEGVCNITFDRLAGVEWRVRQDQVIATVLHSRDAVAGQRLGMLDSVDLDILTRCGDCEQVHIDHIDAGRAGTCRHQSDRSRSRYQGRVLHVPSS